jgi:hypothetical protein
MTYPLEYHNVVNRPARRSLQASPALYGMLVLLLLSPSSFAQINGASNSGHFASVAPPTGAIAPRTGPVPPPTGGFVHTGASHSTHSPRSSGSLNHNGNHPPHTANGTAYYPYIYALPVPYAVDISAIDAANNNNDEDADDQGGPAIFDRRGQGPDSYAPPSNDSPQDAPVAQSADPEPPQPPTTLIFKDGHQIEVNNYAIVSQTLYDLTPGHPRKIALADLDLAATQKQNDDHGVTFQLPPQPQAN